MNKLFVAFSHNLTQDQISDFKNKFGGDSEIETLSNVDSELQKEFSNVNPRFDSNQIKDLARQILQKVVESKSNYFYVAGEPTLQMYCSLLASKLNIKLVQSTTERISQDIKLENGEVERRMIFKHVQWREVKTDIEIDNSADKIWNKAKNNNPVEKWFNNGMRD